MSDLVRGDTLQAMRKAGLSYAITWFPDAAYDRTTIERFEREIMPEIDR